MIRVGRGEKIKGKKRKWLFQVGIICASNQQSIEKQKIDALNLIHKVQIFWCEPFNAQTAQGDINGK